MKKKAISMSMAVGAMAGMAHAQSTDDFEQYKHDIKKKFEIAVKQQQSDFERFNRERTARFNDYVNRIAPADKAENTDSTMEKINEEYIKFLECEWKEFESFVYKAEPAEPQIPYPVIKDSTDFVDGALYYKMMNNPELEKNKKLTPKQRVEYKTFTKAIKDYEAMAAKRLAEERFFNK